MDWEPVAVQVVRGRLVCSADLVELFPPFAIHWDEQFIRRVHVLEACHGPVLLRRIILAIVPATPSTLDGLCGAEQRYGVNSTFW